MSGLFSTHLAGSVDVLFYRDITVLGFDIAGGVDHFTVGIARSISLHPQIVAREDIAALVGDGVSIKRQIICRVQQRRIDDGFGALSVREPRVPVKPATEILPRLVSVISPPPCNVPAALSATLSPLR